MASYNMLEISVFRFAFFFYKVLPYIPVSKIFLYTGDFCPYFFSLMSSVKSHPGHFSKSFMAICGHYARHLDLFLYHLTLDLFST